MRTYCSALHGGICVESAPLQRNHHVWLTMMVACPNFDQCSCTFVASFRQTTSAHTVVMHLTVRLLSTSVPTLVGVIGAVGVVSLRSLRSLREAVSFVRLYQKPDT